MVFAQDQKQAELNPLATADELFARLVPNPTEEDEKTLAEINVSRQDEARWGNGMVKAFLADLKNQRIKVRKKGKDVEYVRALVRTIQPHMRNTNRYPAIEVGIVESPIPDARSFPGGTVFFYRGLFEIAESEAALIGVVGHELAHLDHGHQLLPVKQSRLLEQTIAQNGRNFEPWRFLENGSRMARLMSRPFRPQDEATADQDAVDWMYLAGYDPREFSQLLVRLHDQVAMKENLPIPGFLRTHPPTLERAESVLLQLEKLQNRTPQAKLYRGRANLERRIPKAK